MRRKFLVLFVSFVFVTGSSGWGAAEVPTPVSPGGIEGVVLIGENCPTFLWGGVKDASAFELAVYRVEDGADGVSLEPALQVTLSGSATGWTPALHQCLERRGRYAWTVRARGDATDTGDWSEPRLFEVSPGPALAEVDEALAVLRRYTASKESIGGQQGPPNGIEPGAPSPLPHQRSARSRKRLHDTQAPELERPDSQVGRNLDRRPNGGTTGKPAELGRPTRPLFRNRPGELGTAAPTLGTASLTVDEQIHLGPESSVFKEQEVFLWGDSDNTALGRRALQSNTTGSFNTASGFGALRSNTTGSRNTAFGVATLNYNLTGTDSTAVGYLALRNSTGDPTYGAYNTAVGSLALFSTTTGDRNTAIGFQALGLNTTGYNNTANGVEALLSNTTGSNNTACGFRVLRSNTTGLSNSALGRLALAANTTGSVNTAGGTLALYSNTTGGRNTAFGGNSLLSNTTGDVNTAIGVDALRSNTTGFQNTAAGVFALQSNTTGVFNTASGFSALSSATTAGRNTALGHRALQSNTTGSQNTASGAFALYSNSTGWSNVAIGDRAGFNATTGHDNIFISHEGVAGDANTIRIGTQGRQSRSFVAGIHTALLSGGMPHAVYVDDTGQLGAPPPSSRRFKDEIEDMGEASGALLGLRPVTFRYKEEVVSGTRSVEFGLIAEEVAELYPDLVAYDQEGRPFTVRYQVLIPLLLNELQRQQRQIQELTARVGRLKGP